MLFRNRDGHPRILHVSGDFPDPVDPLKTPVIRSLLDLTDGDFTHRVVSINRRTPSSVAELGQMLNFPSRGEQWPACQPFDHGLAVTYLAPGRGLLHRTMLDRLGDWLAGILATAPVKPDLLMAHKLTIEGLAVERAARLLGLQFALTIQGNTDRKIIAARPDLRCAFGRVYKRARTVFTFSPVARDAIEATLGKREDGIRILPCPTDLDSPLPPRMGGDGLVSVFHLRNHRVKNLRGMARAMRLAEPSEALPPLSIIGGGTAGERAQCQAIIGTAPGMRLTGPLDRVGIRHRLNTATALLQPSLSESFGLVFVEALFAGLPIIYPAGTAIDGYFDGADFALRVDPRDPKSILSAIRIAVRREVSMKAALREWQLSAAAQRFSRSAIAETFRDGLRNSCPAGTVHD